MSAVSLGGFRPSGQQVTTALLETERWTKQQRQLLPVEALLGSWRLCFTAPKKPAFKAGQPVGKGFYIPRLVQAWISFSQDNPDDGSLTVQNQLWVGPVQIRFSGPAKFLAKKNLLAFDFVRLEVFLSHWRLLNQPVRGGKAKVADFGATSIAKLPFFAFFAATDQYIAARGRGGGLALWAKVNFG
ncbi:MAG: hypothetical protein HC922_02910 [Leptolyngbyaceae cyanobacterium SM2_3_12]|nr:hypothetical protein [Leptolyngbyaceae cyanobacterium SM2_3_12]